MGEQEKDDLYYLGGGEAGHAHGLTEGKKSIPGRYRREGEKEIRKEIKTQDGRHKCAGSGGSWSQKSDQGTLVVGESKEGGGGEGGVCVPS